MIGAILVVASALVLDPSAPDPRAANPAAATATPAPSTPAPSASAPSTQEPAAANPAAPNSAPSSSAPSNSSSANPAAAEPSVANPAAANPASCDSGASKKSEWLAAKAQRKDVIARHARELTATPILTLHNVWTKESLPIALAKESFAPVASFDELARCHYTNQSTSMDPRLLDTVVKTAHKFNAHYVEVVSGFRAPKYQLMLRKKGHEVARDSEHPRGQAVDFRIPTVPTRTLLRYVKSLHLGGVGYYPDSSFVHADVGRVRYWRGH